MEKIVTCRPDLIWSFARCRQMFRGQRRGDGAVTIVLELVLLFTSLFAIPLARQSCFYASFFARFEVVGVTLDFLDDVLLLNLPFKPAQRIFERLAFLYANLCQRGPTSKPANLALL